MVVERILHGLLAALIGCVLCLLELGMRRWGFQLDLDRLLVLRFPGWAGVGSEGVDAETVQLLVLMPLETARELLRCLAARA